MFALHAVICRDGYVLRNEYCYRYYQIAEDFSAANRSCARDGASLVFIDSAEEDQYVRDTFFADMSETEFWIGLNDMETEGIFRFAVKPLESGPSGPALWVPVFLLVPTRTEIIMRPPL